MSRGWFGIGLENPKREVNQGTLWRSAVCLGASLTFTVGRRYMPVAADTTKSWARIPYLPFGDFETFNRAKPYKTPVIGVEISADSQPLETFAHPERCLYILGPEDGSLSEEITAICDTVVSFSSAYCLNVAMAGTVVMYDRQLKQRKCHV